MKFLMVLLTLFSSPVFALTTGVTAPNFILKGIKKEVSLADFKGKVIVLEWLNHSCPFVRKHYDSGNMQALQKKYTEQDVIWLSIISSAKNGQYKSAATDILLDPSGDVGKLYEAKTTPHMYIINKHGLLVYQGAIDESADTDKKSILTAKNYVSEALDEVLKGQEVKVHTTKAYGCSIKY